jgi:hypothetical protein
VTTASGDEYTQLWREYRREVKRGERSAAQTKGRGEVRLTRDGWLKKGGPLQV